MGTTAHEARSIAPSAPLTNGTPAPDDTPEAHRSAIERALVEVSHLLVAAGEVDLREVLRVLGGAVEAELAFFVPAPADADDEAPTLPVAVWHRGGAEAEQHWLTEENVTTAVTRGLAAGEPHAQRSCYVAPHLRDGGTTGVAIPLLSRGDRFVGYLGVEHAALPPEALREHAHVLSVFGDLLVGHLSRTRAERALRESEERWRRLVVSHPEPILITSGDAILYANEACARLFGEGDPADLLARSVRDFLPAEQYDLVERRPAPDGGAPLEHEIIRLDGEHRLVEAVASPVTFKGLPALQTVLRDVTERKRSEERYRTFVQTISEGVWCLDLDLPVSTLAHPRVQADLIREHGVLTECNAMMTRLLGASEPEHVLGQRMAVLLPELGPALPEAFVEGGYRLHNCEVPLRRDGATRHFSLNAVGRVERDALVRIWGSCVEVTDRVELEQRMVAVLEEQQERIARDLHDSVGQLLTGIRMLSENLGARHFQPGDDGYATARRVAGFAEEALQRVREICRGLVPPQLYQEGLATALAALVANLDGLSGVACTFLHDGWCDVTADDQKLQLYRIAQEATSNALKHAQPRHVWVHLYAEGGAVVLEVEDDGAGFDAERGAGRTLGLYSMQRRASSIQATLSIEAAPGAGTTVRVVLPSPSGRTAA